MTHQHSALRQRMIDDMTFRNMSPNSRKAYVRAIANFSAFHGCSPHKLSLEDVIPTAAIIDPFDRFFASAG